MNKDQLFSVRQKSEDLGGLASWEEPHLSCCQSIRAHWRQAIVHLWGPAGSVVFHVVAVGALLAFTVGTSKEYVESDVVVIPTTYTPEPIEPPPQVPVKPEVTPPDQVLDNVLPSEEVQAGFDVRDSLEPEGGSGLQDEGTGLGKGSPLLQDKTIEIAVIDGRLKLEGLVANETGGGKLGDRLKKYRDTNRLAPANENAVVNALRWLKREQQTDGSWRGNKQNVLPAMTSMALLAFLAHGEKADSGEFGPTVKRGIEWLLANQESDGHFKGRDGHDYAQPIAAYALCEAYALTGHLKVKDAAIRAVTPVVRGQNAAGGFNYNLDQSQRNDSSYMAWCCQALKAAHAAKLQDDVPGLAAAMKSVVSGFKQNADPNGGFGYTGSGRSGLSGAGALCLQLMGAGDASEVRHTMKFLEPCRFSFATPEQQPYGGGSPLYYWYYITQAKFNHSKATFDAWDQQFSPELRRTQVIEKRAISGPDGKLVDVGYWESPAKGEHTGGVVQDTVLCTLMLEVYYRYLSTFHALDYDSDSMARATGAVVDDSEIVLVR